MSVIFGFSTNAVPWESTNPKRFITSPGTYNTSYSKDDGLDQKDDERNTTVLTLSEDIDCQNTNKTNEVSERLTRCRSYFEKICSTVCVQHKEEKSIKVIEHGMHAFFFISIHLIINHRGITQSTQLTVK